MMGKPMTQLYEIESMVMDNAADGKGEKNGLGVNFNKVRKEHYDKVYPIKSKKLYIL